MSERTITNMRRIYNADLPMREPRPGEYYLLVQPLGSGGSKAVREQTYRVKLGMIDKDAALALFFEAVRETLREHAASRRTLKRASVSLLRQLPRDQYRPIMGSRATVHYDAIADWHHDGNRNFPHVDETYWYDAAQMKRRLTMSATLDAIRDAYKRIPEMYRD